MDLHGRRPAHRAGRKRSANTIDVGDEHDDIEAGIQRASTADFRQQISGRENVYGDGRAAQRIVAKLKSVLIDEALLRKPPVRT